MNQAAKKLGLIAGSGYLPKEIIDSCKVNSRDIFVIALEDITENTTINNTEHELVHIGKVGKIIKLLKKNNIDEIVLAGRVGRPSPSSLKLDFTAIRLLKKFMKLPSQGDDKIFSTIIELLEEKGFDVIGADDVLHELLIKEEVLGTIKPDKIAEKDIQIGVRAALEIGKLDIGQAVITQQGMILGVEGAEGTDRLVERCKKLHNQGLGGVLIKMKKPGQDRRVDLPSIGVHTIENAHKSGLRGIAVEAGGALIINKENVIKRADELGIFIVGIKAKKII